MPRRNHATQVVGATTLAKDAVLRNLVQAGANKYVSEADNVLMMQTPLVEGFLDKTVERLTGLAKYSRHSVTFVWGRLVKHKEHLVLLYTKKTAQGFQGATKKIYLGRVCFKKERISVAGRKEGKGTLFFTNGDSYSGSARKRAEPASLGWRRRGCIP